MAACLISTTIRPWAPAALTINGGTINSTASGITAGNAQNWNADITFLGSNSLTLNGGVTLNSNRQITVNANTLTMGGSIGGSYGLTKAGAGTLYLTAGNSYSGGTTVNGGTLQLAGDGSNGIIGGNLTINGGATVNTSTTWSLGYGSGYSVSSISINGGNLNFYTGGANNGGTSASTVTMTGGTISGLEYDWYNGITSTPTLTTNASTATAVISSGFRLRLNNNNITFNVAQGSVPGGVDCLVSGSISSAFSDGLIKTGPGLLSLTTGNLYGGGTTVSGGTLALAADGGSGIIVGNLVVNSGATVAPNVSWGLGYSNGYCVNAITLNGGVLNFTGAANGGGTSASTITMTGGTISGAQPAWYNGITSTPTLASNASTATAVISSGLYFRLSNNYATFNVASGTTASGVDLLVSGPITSAFSDGIVKSGAGLMSLTAANSYAGGTSVNAGTLLIDRGSTVANDFMATSGYTIASATLQLNYNGTSGSRLEMPTTPFPAREPSPSPVPGSSGWPTTVPATIRRSACRPADWSM